MLNDVNFFRKYANEEILGIQPARRFEDMANFLETFRKGYDGNLFSTTYTEGYGVQMLRGFYENVDELDKEEIHIKETHDLHSISISENALEYFIDFVKEKNENYFDFYREQTTKPKKTSRRKK